jgi:malate dehydrogenase (oxaloacetate-decarboxylating)(NADP+)
VRPTLIMCTGRSDYPNQVNNVLCFPYIFRGALDAGATTINEEMKRAAVAQSPDWHAKNRPMSPPAPMAARRSVRPELPDPIAVRPRLILRIAPAVAKAAMESGVATRPIEDFDAYMDRLNRFVFRSGLIMKPIIQAARMEPSAIVYAEGEDERVLRAAQVLLEDKHRRADPDRPTGSPGSPLRAFGLKIRPGVDFEYVNPQDDPRYRDYVDEYLACVGRQGMPPDAARTVVRTNTTVIADPWPATRRGRCGDLRAGRPLHPPPARYSPDHRPARTARGICPPCPC